MAAERGLPVVSVIAGLTLSWYSALISRGLAGWIERTERLPIGTWAHNACTGAPAWVNRKVVSVTEAGAMRSSKSRLITPSTGRSSSAEG